MNIEVLLPALGYPRAILELALHRIFPSGVFWKFYGVGTGIILAVGGPSSSTCRSTETFLRPPWIFLLPSGHCEELPRPCSLQIANKPFPVLKCKQDIEIDLRPPASAIALEQDYRRAGTPFRDIVQEIPGNFIRFGGSYTSRRVHFRG